MMRTPIVILLLLGPAGTAVAAPGAELTALLQEFLAGASRHDPAAHERFWSDDLIYTASAGRRIGKADILADVRATAPPAPGEPRSVYTAEEIRIQDHGDTAVVAFRLVETTTDGRTATVARYLNTGTFRRDEGRWRAVAWQATRMPRPEEESRQAVAAAHDAFHRALVAADVATLEAILEDDFAWTHDDGETQTRAGLIETVRTRRLRDPGLEWAAPTIVVKGDTAIARGTTTRPRRVDPGSGPAGDAAQVTSFHTLTFAFLQGRWKAVAMHTSRN